MRRGIFISVRTGSERLPNKSILKIKDKFTIEFWAYYDYTTDIPNLFSFITIVIIACY